MGQGGDNCKLDAEGWLDGEGEYVAGGQGSERGEVSGEEAVVGLWGVEGVEGMGQEVGGAMTKGDVDGCSMAEEEVWCALLAISS